MVVRYIDIGEIVLRSLFNRYFHKLPILLLSV